MKNILFLVPFFNEEINLIEIVKLIKKSSKIEGYNYKILFLNDCSTDKSFETIQEYKNTNNEDNILLFENKKNMGHGKSLLRLFDLSSQYMEETTHVVTLDSDLKIETNDFNELFNFQNSVICKRKRFEEGLFRAFITFCAEILVFLKTGNFWRDANCPLRLYTKKDFLALLKVLPKNILTPNIAGTILTTKLNLEYDRKSIQLIYESKNSGVTWQGKQPLSKYKNILLFSFKSFKEIISL